MSDAPEQIWAWPADAKGHWVDQLTDGFGTAKPAKKSVEYVRADIHRTEIERLTVALDTAPAVTVKPLVFEEVDRGRWSSGYSLGGEYVIRQSRGDAFGYYVTRGRLEVFSGREWFFETPEQAEAAAQADYADRILACIEKGGDA